MTERRDDAQLPPITAEGSEEGSGAAGAMPQVEGYQIVEPIGQGGMGTVWRAVQLSTRRLVALKLLGKGAFGSEKARARFEREVELTARLQHPNVARIYDSGLQRSGCCERAARFETAAFTACGIASENSSPSGANAASGRKARLPKMPRLCSHTSKSA